MLENNANMVTAVPGQGSAALMEIKRRYVPDSLHTSTDIFVQEADGALIKDIDGNVYLDFASSSTNVGHCSAEVMDAIEDQMKRYLHSSFCTIPYEPYVRLAERLSILSPIKDGKVLLTNSGLYAKIDAVRIAREYTRRRAVAVLETDDDRDLFLDTCLIPCPDNFRDEEYLKDYAEELKRILDDSSREKTIACMIIQPVQTSDRLIPLSKSFVRLLHAECQKRGILLIMDESETGMARTGTLFASEHFDIEPDFIVLSRSLATGIPVGAVIGRGELMENGRINIRERGSGGSPIACRAALSVLDNMEKYQLHVRSRALGEYILSSLEKIKAKCPLVGSICVVGALASIELVKADTKEPFPQLVPRIIMKCLQNGVLLYHPKENSNFIQLYPSLVMTMEQARCGMHVLRDALLSCM